MMTTFGNKLPINQAYNYMFKVNNRNTRTRCETYPKLKIKIPERRQASFWCLYCYLRTYFTPCSSVSIVNFEQVNAGLFLYTQLRRIPKFHLISWCEYFVERHTFRRKLCLFTKFPNQKIR